MIRSSAMMRRMATRGIDWTGLAGKVSSTGARGEIARLRAVYDDINADVIKANEPVADIDWKAYQSKISTPGLVDEFKGVYESLNIPSFENTRAAEADQILNKLVGEAKAAMDASEARAVELEAQLAAMESNKTTTETTIDDVQAQYPHIKTEVEQEIKDQEWGKGIVN